MRARTDGDHEALLQLPDALDRFVVAILARLCVDAIGGATQREFAQCDQIAFAEEVRDRVCGLLGHVHLARLQALDQIVRRQVDELHFVRLVEHAVGHRFRDPDVRDLPNDVVEALEVLHVDGGVDVDSGRQQFLDVLPAFRVTRARRVAVREFVDEHQVGAAREHRVDVEFVQHRTAILDAALRNHRQAVQQRFGVGAPMCLRYADHDVDALGQHFAGFGQHRVRLADAGARAEEDLQPTRSGARLGALDFFQQFVGIGTLLDHRWQTALDGSTRSVSGTLQVFLRCCTAAAAHYAASLRLLDAAAVDLVATLTARAARSRAAASRTKHDDEPETDPS